jgi:hypothetical protein
MYKTKSKISIFVALMLLCSGGFAGSQSNSENIFGKYSKAKAKDIHIKADIEKQSIAKYFINSELVEAELIGNICLKQQDYPEPITLLIKKVPSGAIKQIKLTQDWDNKGAPYCRANSWAKYDVGSKRVLINVSSITCEHQKLEFDSNRGSRFVGAISDWSVVDSVSVGASIEGTIYGEDFIKGLRGEIMDNRDIEFPRYVRKVLVKFMAHDQEVADAK